jgi:DNA-binding response OmpR family regulator
MAIAATASATPREMGVEELRARIAALVARRQQLRALGASRTMLEQNRLELASSQRELGYALIERHLSPSTPA